MLQVLDWKSAVYQKVREEETAGGRLSVEVMLKLGRVPGPASTV